MNPLLMVWESSRSKGKNMGAAAVAAPFAFRHQALIVDYRTRP